MSGATLTGYEALRFSRRGRIDTVHIDQPSTRNAVNDTLHHEFARVFYELNDDPESDVVVLTGTGKLFCAGGEYSWFQDMIDRPDLWLKDVVPKAKRIISGLLELEKPIICRLNGAAAGLGASVALLCDIIIAADGAIIGDPHVKAGLVAGDGGVIIWPQLIGFARAKEMLLTGRTLTAERAAAMGLINQVVPFDELDAKVDALADELVSGATMAIRWTKTVMNLELRRIHVALTDAALGFETVTNSSADHQEAVHAFKAKRKPEFKGRRTPFASDQGVHLCPWRPGLRQGRRGDSSDRMTRTPMRSSILRRCGRAASSLQRHEGFAIWRRRDTHSSPGSHSGCNRPPNCASARRWRPCSRYRRRRAASP